MEVAERVTEHENENDGYTNCNWCSRNGRQKHGIEFWGIGDQQKTRPHPGHISGKIILNSLKKLDVTQFLAEYHVLILALNTWKEYDNSTLVTTLYLSKCVFDVA